MVGKRFNRRSSLFVAVMASVVTACSSAGSGEAVSASQTTETPQGVTAAFPSSSATSVEPQGAAAVDLTDASGILVGKRRTDTTDPYEIGTVDPATGVYEALVAIPPVFRFHPGGPDGPGNRISPDLTRVAGRTVASDGTESVGWYDLDGEFHPVGPVLKNGAFDEPVHFDTVNYDWLGRINYTTKVEGTLDFEGYMIDPDTEQAVPVDAPVSAYGVAFMSDGTYVQRGVTANCSSGVYSFSLDGTGLAASTSSDKSQQVVAYDKDCVNSRDLLPATNVNDVYQPVMTRDQKSVAFLLGDSTPEDLYVVPFSGAGTPQQVPGDWSDYDLLQWRIPVGE